MIPAGRPAGAPLAGGARSGVRRVAERAACVLGADRVSRRMHARSLLVLCYHGVRADDAPRRHWLLMPRAEFRAQMAYVARHYRCLSIDDAIDALRRGALSEPTACVTFDDGYRNNRTEALPVLRELGIPATVYLSTGLIGTDRRLWTTALELRFERTTATTADLRPLGLGVAALHDPGARARAAKAACEALKLLPAVERAERAAALAATLPLADGGDSRPGDDGAFAMMDWDDVRAMEETGLVTFGAHTVNHEIVSRLDDDALADEIGGSMDAVAARVSRPSRTFAYPNGRPCDYDSRAATVIRRAGGTAALTTDERLNGPDADPFAIARVTLGGDVTMANFRLRVAGLGSWRRRGAA